MTATVDPDQTQRVERLLAAAGVPELRRGAVRDRLVPSGASSGPPPVGHRHRIGVTVTAVVLAQGLTYGSFLAVWAVAGAAALDRSFSARDGVAFAVAAAGVVVGRWCAVQATGRLAVAAGGRLKHRLLLGALSLDPDEVSRRGPGELLGVTLEADALESLALDGGQLAVLATVELGVAGAVLAVAAGDPAWALLAWLVAAGVVGARYMTARRRWTDARLALTADLVEQLVGHRTRLAQSAPDDHQTDLAGYAGRSARVDRLAAALVAIVPRGWLLLGLALTAPALRDGPTSSDVAAVGAVLFAWHALDKLVLALTQLADAAIAWGRVAPVLRAKAVPEDAVPPATGAVVEGDELSFAHPGRPPALAGVSVTIRRGERIVVTGPSGAGKSTLVALLAGLRRPGTGTVRRSGSVVLAPQFHENHVMSASVAFNLLLGRHWPPRPEDLQAAWDVCRDLGLDTVLAAMPGGLQQPIGECGWQLSHGEQSRLFIARALLQQPDVVILDESLGALDPASFRRALDAVTARVATVVVVAHP